MISDRPIVALATPQGVSALAVIRISGDNCHSLFEPLFSNKRFKRATTTTVLHGFIHNTDGLIIDEVMLVKYIKPTSFTGEDSIEITCHGNPFVIEAILNVLYQSGFVPALPGEFTRRAFLNGKLDLTRVEAIGDLIHAESPFAYQNAIKQLKGDLANTLLVFRERLLELTALLELELDFSEEDVEFASRDKFTEIIDALKRLVGPLIESFKTGNAAKRGIRVAIIGKPNAGKSTLLNRLVGDERAIVTSYAGTTRDAIEEVVIINQVAYRFIDTAGLRVTTDEVEKLGIEISRKKIANADIILILLDATSPDLKSDYFSLLNEISGASVPYLLLLNKIDLAAAPDFLIGNAHLLQISAKNNKGIVSLTEKLTELSKLNNESGETTITNSRHLNHLIALNGYLINIEQSIYNNEPTELLSANLRYALAEIGSITGEVTNDETLGYIFGKFCIGK